MNIEFLSAVKDVGTPVPGYISDVAYVVSPDMNG